MSIYDVPEIGDTTTFQYWSWEIVSSETIFSYLYIIQEGEDGPVKFGISKYPEKRLKELQTGNSSKLKIILKRKGLFSDEKRIHRLLENFKVKGEWFEFCPPVMSVIEELKY